MNENELENIVDLIPIPLEKNEKSEAEAIMNEDLDEGLPEAEVS